MEKKNMQQQHPRSQSQSPHQEGLKQGEGDGEEKHAATAPTFTEPKELKPAEDVPMDDGNPAGEVSAHQQGPQQGEVARGGTPASSAAIRGCSTQRPARADGIRTHGS